MHYKIGPLCYDQSDHLTCLVVAKIQNVDAAQCKELANGHSIVTEESSNQ